jgi:hypothetical protein
LPQKVLCHKQYVEHYPVNHQEDLQEPLLASNHADLLEELHPDLNLANREPFLANPPEDLRIDLIRLANPPEDPHTDLNLANPHIDLELVDLLKNQQKKQPKDQPRNLQEKQQDVEPENLLKE